MKNKIKISLLTIFSMLLVQGIYAYKQYPTNLGDNSGSGSGNHRETAEACQASAGATDLDLNNVRARINTGGDMWWDLQGTARYEIPKGSRKCSMFSGSLWMAGVDVNGQLKCAAQRYRNNGNDFWSGPLTTDGTASIDAATCVKYDKHFKITRADVNQFVAYKLDPNSMPGYTVPPIIKDWPAHGDVSMGQDYYLAPFFDNDGDGTYNTDNGDYPLYDLKGTVDCHKSDGDRILFGDMTLWWVFNDKGNIHSETGGAPIGMEIRAQAFAFATNDEINNMTFYNYQMINRSTYTLTNTYFSQWADTDLGESKDDFVGCDVQRGLGYCYNGTEVDGTGKPTEYGSNPPAIGIDFFQGPYMDKDGLDNPKGIDEGINGVNFGDGVVDNERFGMKRFVFHNNTGSGAPWAITDPDKAVEYYQLLQGIWKDGTVMMYGGNGYISGAGTCGPRAKFMFPGNTDPLHWGTDYQIPNCNPDNWTEETVHNTPYDRRFMHSAGPFTLKPGAVNFITVGVPWARAASGGPAASVQLLKAADDKCQRLFDNCFKVVNGPDAPDMAVQEMDKEIILTLSNPTFSNNYAEMYPYRTDGTVAEFDFSIITPQGQTVRYDSLFRFQGYQIFQLKDNTVTLAEAFNARNGGYDPDKVRIVAQCDIKDNVSRLINYYFDETLGANVPVEAVNGENKGIKHSFRILNDEFATGDKRLINHKKYYYIAISYANNEFKKYNPMDGASLDGQKMPYKAGRKSPIGAIRMLTAIPHDPTPDVDGTAFMAPYGYGPKITRIEGQGNGGLILDLTPESENELLAITQSPYIIYHPQYQNARGPISVKVIDPLNVPDANFTLKFLKGTLNAKDSIVGAKWTLTNETTGKIYTSEKAICVAYQKPFVQMGVYYNPQPYEQIIPEIGLSVTIQQTFNPGDFHADSLLFSDNFGLLESSLTYADSSKQWLGAVPDMDGSGDFDWICSGAVDGHDYSVLSPTKHWMDEKQVFEKMVGGNIAPYRLALASNSGNAPAYFTNFAMNQLSAISSVNIVFTADKDKWTRCPVIELCPDVPLSEGSAQKFGLRKGASRDKDGNTGTPEATDNGTHPYGMSWFPGYAINIETGERLNIMFGEDSWMVGERGRDMWFNPTSNYATDLGSTLFGGKHYMYVMGHNSDTTISGKPCSVPAYDKGNYIWSKLSSTPSNWKWVYRDAMYVTMPMAVRGREADWLSNDAKIRIRVAKPYKPKYAIDGASSPQNKNMPMYTFNTSDIATKKNDPAIAKASLYKINVVPNPYYAYSSYERSQLDNTVKITNLPNKCSITIFTLSGTLVRKYEVDKAGITLPRASGSIEPKTSIDWDLKNEAGIPIASGIYLIHVNVEGVGERTIKWFGTLRPVDLDSF